MPALHLLLIRPLLCAYVSQPGYQVTRLCLVRGARLSVRHARRSDADDGLLRVSALVAQRLGRTSVIRRSPILLRLVEFNVIQHVLQDLEYTRPRLAVRVYLQRPTSAIWQELQSACTVRGYNH